MREIEIKVVVDNYEKMNMLLISKGWHSSIPVHQLDIIYTDKKVSFADIRNGTTVTRIRIQDNNDFTLNVKVPQSCELDCIEHETKIENLKETINILSLLNLHEVMRVDKVRKIGKIGDLTICLDIVEGLGCFVEFERLCSDEADIDKVKNEIWHEIESLAISPDNEVFHGYDTLLYNKVDLAS